jgi:cytochrome oxidase Cu insertion factor (SCO1/SenC/PrrC family)
MTRGEHNSPVAPLRGKRMRMLLGASTMAFGLAFSFNGCGQADKASDKTNKVAHTSKPLPAWEIDGEDLEGQPMKLSSFKGKIVVLDFWGNW